MLKNRIIQRLTTQAYSSNIPIGKDSYNIQNLIQEYNESNKLIKLIKLAQVANNPNRNVNLKFAYQLCSNYKSLTTNKSVFVTTDIQAVNQNPIDKSKIYVWDVFILEMTKDSWHNEIDFREMEAKENKEEFDLQQVIKNLQKMKYIMVVVSYSLIQYDVKNIIFDEYVLENNLSQELQHIFNKVSQNNSNFKIINNPILIKKIKDNITDQLHVY